MSTPQSGPDARTAPNDPAVVSPGGGDGTNALRATIEESIDEEHLYRQIGFSHRTFGPGPRTQGVTDHIAKELDEIRSKPEDLEEWVDVIILAFDGAWRTGATPGQIIAAIKAKQTKNEARDWPDWRTSDPGKAIEHVRAVASLPTTKEQQ